MKKKADRQVFLEQYEREEAERKKKEDQAKEAKKTKPILEENER